MKNEKTNLIGQFGEVPSVDVSALENGAEGELPWTRIATYGDVTNRLPVSGKLITQRFNRPEAQTLVSAFVDNSKRLLARLGFVNGAIPVFNGHPDGNVKKGEPLDMTQYAQIKAMDAREDGLYAQIEKSSLFNSLLEKIGTLEYSPNWMAQSEDGAVWKPYLLKSLGMVPKGNLKNATLVNALEESDPAEKILTPKSKKMEITTEQVAELAALLGAEAAQITDVEALKTLLAQKLAEGKKPEEGEDDEKPDTQPASPMQNAIVENAAQALVDAAFLNGKLAATECDAWKKLLIADFANAKIAFDAKIATPSPTSQKTIDRAKKIANQRNEDAEKKHARILGLCNARISELKAKGLPLPKFSALYAELENIEG